MNLAIIGAPGSGKTTHARQLSQEFGLTHLDISDLIHQAIAANNPKSSLLAAIATKKGSLLPDGIIFDLLLEAIPSNHFEHLLIDGFPRNTNQLFTGLDLFTTNHTLLDAIIFLDLDDSTSVARILDRHRHDDQPQAIAQRIEQFHRFNLPLLEEIKLHTKLIKLDSSAPFEQVSHSLHGHITTLNHSLPESRQSHPNTTPITKTPITAIEQHENQSQSVTLYVLTHSESDFNARHIFTGRTDVTLTKEGIRKAKLAGQILKNKPLDLAIRTSLTRTGQTLAEIINYHPNLKIETDDRFIERDYGELSGQSKDQYAQEHPDLYPIYHRSYDVPPPGGESMATVETRVMAGLKDLIARMKQQHLNVIIVAHGNSIRPIRKYFEHLTNEQMMKLEHLRHQIFTYTIPIN